jgi:hypothetical protein
MGLHKIKFVALFVLIGAMLSLHTKAFAQAQPDENLPKYLYDDQKQALQQFSPVERQALQDIDRQIKKDAYAFTMRLCYGYQVMTSWKAADVSYQMMTDPRLRDSLLAWGYILGKGFVALYDPTNRFYWVVQGKGILNPHVWAGSIFTRLLETSRGYVEAQMRCLMPPDKDYPDLANINSTDSGLSLRAKMAQFRQMSDFMNRANWFTYTLVAADRASGFANIASWFMGGEAAIARVLVFLKSIVPVVRLSPGVIATLQALRAGSKIAAVAGGGIIADNVLLKASYDSQEAQAIEQIENQLEHPEKMAHDPTVTEQRLQLLAQTFQLGYDVHALSLKKELTAEEQQAYQDKFNMFKQQITEMVPAQDELAYAQKALQTRESSLSDHEQDQLRLLKFMIPIIEGRKKDIEAATTAPQTSKPAAPVQ